MGITKCQYCARQCIYWSGINEDIRKMVEVCPTCQCHCPQEPRQPLEPTPVPECPWQHLGADYCSFDGFEYLVIVNYYSKMLFVRRIPPSQCNAAKTISVLKELFSKHGIPETIRSDNGPQFAAINSPSSLRSGTLITLQVHPGTQGVMAKPKLLSRLQKVSSPMPSIQGRIPTLPCWHTGVHPLMHTFTHQLRCSTREQ